MAQFDVYANPSKAQRGEIPWMVDIQSKILDKLPTCLVMPLALRATCRLRCRGPSARPSAGTQRC
ncbi:CcdB family protein (plasmid) [Variovorax sp. 375MFSha3.1]|uniref:CcdB family protein n=1 Tax=unclassified Variovorax TaxID=663243 RepID=UPI003AAF645E